MEYSLTKLILKFIGKWKANNRKDSFKQKNIGVSQLHIKIYFKPAVIKQMWYRYKDWKETIEQL